MAKKPYLVSEKHQEMKAEKRGTERGVLSVTEEFSLIYAAYNRRQSVFILSFTELMTALKSWNLNLAKVENPNFSYLSCWMLCAPLTANAVLRAY